MEKQIKNQWKILTKLLPELKGIECPKEYKESSEAEEYFVIPHYKLFGTYNEAVLNLLKVIKKTRPCYDWRSGNWTEKYLKQTQRKVDFWNKQQDVIILGTQLGNKWKGKSVKEVRENYSKNELGLGIYEVLIILLLKPDILEKYEDLFLDCAGDEYSYVADGVFSKSPLFAFYNDLLKFVTRDVSGADGHFGSVSAFLPQTLENAIKICKEAGLKVIKIKTIEEEL